MSRNTYASIDLGAVVSNFTLLASLNPQGNTLAVIKANAYGHGAINIAKALTPLAKRFAVAFMDEAQTLRRAGIETPMVSLQGAYCMEEMRWAAENGVAVVVHRREQLDWIGKLPGAVPAIWLKIDTGMHRLGFMPEQIESLVSTYSHLFSDDTIFFTHLASADEQHNPQTERQLETFAAQHQHLQWPTSIANSGGILNWPLANGDWNRAGIAMYGGKASNPEHMKSVNLKPVMSVYADIIAIRDIPIGDTVGYGGSWQAQRASRIATVAIGYADGYPRHAPSGTPAYCNGHRIHLVGRVSMDMVTFDITGLPELAVGDQVELWGANVSVTEVAEHVGTIDYELMTRISDRVPRRYCTR